MKEEKKDSPIGTPFAGAPDICSVQSYKEKACGSRL